MKGGEKNNATVLENISNQKPLCRRPRAIQKAEYHRQRGGLETGGLKVSPESFRSEEVFI